MKAKDWAIFFGLSIAWGTAFMWIKIAVQEIGPFTMTAIRLLIGSVGLLLINAVRKEPFSLTSRDWGVLAVIGITNTAIPFALISWGQQFIDSAVSSILSGSLPLFVAVLAHFFLKDDRLNLSRIVGVLVGFAGVVLLIGRGAETAGNLAIWGQFAVLLGMVFYAFASIYTRLKAGHFSPLIQALVPLVVADLALWMLVPFTELPFQLPVLFNTWGAIIWLGLVSSCLAYLMYFYLLHSIGPTRTSLITYMFPLIGVISGAIFLGEVIDQRMVLGGALVLFSVLIVNNAVGKFWRWIQEHVRAA